MKKPFLIRLLLFFVPLLAYATSTTGVAAYSGEFLPLRQVVALQQGEAPVLYGRAYRDNYFAFKLLSTKARKPEVLSIGSSRMLEFRSMFFNRKSSAFYNAAHAAQSIYAVHQFLMALESSELPKVLIISLDQPWFNASSRFSVAPTAADPVDDETTLDFTHVANVGRNVTVDTVTRKIKLSQIMRRTEPVHGAQAVGLNAIVNGMGFRNDGSYQYGTDIINPPSFASRMEEGFNDLRDNVDSHFIAGADLSQAALDELELILQFARANDMFVIGFAPPYAPTIYGQMMADGKHSYIPKEITAIQALFKRYEFGYFDFSDAAQLGATEDDMVDSFHASEFINLRMYLQMLSALPDVLSPYSDAAFLQPLAQQPPSNRFELFGNRF
jgi:hypothetical protein